MWQYTGEHLNHAFLVSRAFVLQLVFLDDLVDGS